ncbi:MAG: CHRD domain-containing protein [Casimicrobiaceae bacterium]
MQRIRLLALALVTALSLAAPAHAVLVGTAAPLAGTNENPANASPATGNANVVIDTTTHQLRVTVVFSGLVAPTTMAHIHCCTTPPNNVGVATTVPAFVGFPLGVTSGSMDQTYDTTQAGTWNASFITNNGGTTAGAEAALAAGLAAGNAYLNIHTSTFPAGEIRGFLQPQALPISVGANIPTLSEWTMAGLVLLLLAAGFVMLRRRAR